MKLKHLHAELFVLTVLLVNLSNIQSVEANFISESNVNQTTRIIPNSANNNNNLLAMFLIAGVGFSFGFKWPFFPFRRANKTTDKKLKEKKTSESIIETSIETSAENKNNSPYMLYVQKAYNKFEQGDIEGALKNFNDAIRTQPNNAKIYSERAYFRKNKLGDKEGAISDYNQAIDINPNNPLFYFCRSQTYLELGDRHKAIEDYNTGMDIAPENIMYDSTSNEKQN